MLALRLFALCGLLLPAAAAEPLTSLAAVRALPPAEAARGVAVRVEATVLGRDPASGWNLFIHDGTAGCYVNLEPQPGEPPPRFSPGTRIRVAGVSRILGYYPSLARGRATVLGPGELPPPRRLAAEQLFEPEFDSGWVEVPAVLLGVENRDDRITLELEVYGLTLKAELPAEPGAEERAAALLLRPVLLRGVLGTIFNRERQMTDRHFFVPSMAMILPRPLLSEGGTPPVIGVTELLTAGFGPHTPVRVTGVITQTTSNGFYLRDRTGSTRVYATPAEPLPSGTHVEVEGFGGLAPFRPVLRAARVTALGRDTRPAPVPSPQRRQHWPAVHAELITLEAVFLTRQEGRSEAILECQLDSLIFEVLLPIGESRDARFAAGDRLRLTGICELTTTHALPRMGWVDGFRLHLREAAAITVISRAPWWNTERLLAALGLMSTLAALGLAGSWMLRRQVRRQLAIIGDQLRQEAVGKERDRMARDLHDTLEQQLSGVALQLDGVEDAVHRNPAAAAQGLLLARRMLRFTRLEARRSVWDLRSQVLARQGLAAALQAMAEAAVVPGGPRAIVQVRERAERLPAASEFHLLRIAQEALTNALKHSGAREVTLTLEHEPGVSRLTVRDDGRGFHPDSVESAAGFHFGLLGMRERAAKIGAGFSITSAPGAGCTVTVTVPTAASAPSP
ncbi:MAG: sensor histidine kinase [Verrucomicrobia bacterium]|nr:sensor histidine kinase [Verrucomicrobiota bacterium]